MPVCIQSSQLLIASASVITEFYFSAWVISASEVYSNNRVYPLVLLFQYSELLIVFYFSQVASIILSHIRWAPRRIFRPANLFDGRLLEKKSWLLFLGDEDLTSAETLLDTMHQSCFWACHGHSGYGGVYGGGYGPLAGHWKEDVTCKVSNPPLPQK